MSREQLLWYRSDDHIMIARPEQGIVERVPSLFTFIHSALPMPEEEAWVESMMLMWSHHYN